MSNEGESTYFPTAMFASRVYLSVVKRQTKGIAPRCSEGFEIHAALVDGRVGKPKPTENSAKRANAGPTADIMESHVIHTWPPALEPVCTNYLIPANAANLSHVPELPQTSLSELSYSTQGTAQ